MGEATRRRWGPHDAGRRRAAGAAAGLCAALAAGPLAAPAENLTRYDTPYYVLYSDLEPNLAREAYARITAMAEEYHRRTRGFAGTIRRKFDFYLFSQAEDYYQAGGQPGTAGAYTGGRLMALASPQMRGQVWHIIQHEGFHQFAHQVISGRLPPWVNEGLAEYFGEGLWTGDGLVTGVVPPARLRRVQAMIADRKVLPFRQMLDMSQEDWNGQLIARNYDQAWSMVHFLVHGDGGKYLDAFSGYINDLARGGSPEGSFVGRFGRDEAAFQKRYEDWWTSLPADPTAERYTEATVATLGSFLARAELLKLPLGSAQEFFQAARGGQIAIDGARRPRLWLPQSLLEGALAKAGGLGDWSLGRKGRLPTLILKQADGTTFTARFALPAGRHPEVSVEVSRPGPATSPATGRSSER